jgi:hypothetical protein
MMNINHVMTKLAIRAKLIIINVKESVVKRSVGVFMANLVKHLDTSMCQTRRNKEVLFQCIEGACCPATCGHSFKMACDHFCAHPKRLIFADR